MNPEIKVEILENNVRERKISDEKYSPILVQKIVFGLITTIVVSVISIALGVFDKRVDRVLNPDQDSVLQESIVNANI